MFLHADNDGFKLDTNHDTPIEDDDLPGLLSAFGDRDECWQQWSWTRCGHQLDREMVVCRVRPDTRRRLQPECQPLSSSESHE